MFAAFLLVTSKERKNLGAGVIFVLIHLALSSLFFCRVEVLGALCGFLKHFGCGVLKTFGFGYVLLHGILGKGSAESFQSINCKKNDYLKENAFTGNILSRFQFVSRMIINYA